MIATLGLANDQPATVIAAMVVAPLMPPVLGIAASMTLGLWRHTTRLVTVVAAASVGAVLLGWLISSSLVVHEITAEELSRTEPRLRDLIVALAAGAAGMYSVVRKDLSSVIPGVAIAVALVPPLATVGITLELGEWRLARAAALLYGVNVLAIVFAAVVVLLATDFMRSPSLRKPAVSAAAVVTLTLATVIIVPVWQNSRRIDKENQFERNAEAVLHDWDDSHPSHAIIVREITPGSATIAVAGPTRPDDLDELQEELATVAFPAPVLEVEWISAEITRLDD